MEENSKKNAEINEVLGELNLGQTPHLENINSNDVTRKAQEAFKEFELKQKVFHGQQQTSVEVPKIDESLKFKGVDEIEESLKKFSEKSGKEQEQKKIIDDYNISKDTSKIARFTMKISGGLIREEKQAEYVLLGFAILAFLASGYLFYLGIRGNTPTAQKISPEILNQMKQGQPN